MAILNQQRDGHMQMAQPAGRVADEPNSLSKESPRESTKGFHTAAVSENGVKDRIRKGRLFSIDVP